MELSTAGVGDNLPTDSCAEATTLVFWSDAQGVQLNVLGMYDGSEKAYRSAIVLDDRCGMKGQLIQKLFALAQFVPVAASGGDVRLHCTEKGIGEEWDIVSCGLMLDDTDGCRLSVHGLNRLLEEG